MTNILTLILILLPTYVIAKDNKPTEQVDACQCSCIITSEDGNRIYMVKKIVVKGRACRTQENGEACTMPGSGEAGNKAGCETTTVKPRIEQLLNKLNSSNGVLAPTTDTLAPSRPGTTPVFRLQNNSNLSD